MKIKTTLKWNWWKNGLIHFLILQKAERKNNNKKNNIKLLWTGDKGGSTPLESFIRLWSSLKILNLELKQLTASSSWDSCTWVKEIQKNTIKGKIIERVATVKT